MVERERIDYSNDEPTISSDTTPNVYERVRGEPWFAWAVRILAVIVIILILVFGGRWLHHSLQNKNNPSGVPTAANQSPSASNKKASGAGSSSNSSGSTSNNSGSKSASGSKSGSTAVGPSLKSGSQNQQLANTGPGAVVAIFLATTFAVASLHYAYEYSKNS